MRVRKEKNERVAFFDGYKYKINVITVLMLIQFRWIIISRLLKERRYAAERSYLIDQGRT